MGGTKGRRRLWLTAALLWAAGCGAPSAPAPTSDAGSALPDEGAGLRVEVGVGQQGSYQSVSEGGTLRLQRGCQGSQHVFVALRAGRLDPLRATVELALVRAADGEVVSLPYRVRLPFEPSTEGAELGGLLLVVPDPAQALGEVVILRGSIEDAAGNTASDERTGVLQWGPDACG